MIMVCLCKESWKICGIVLILLAMFIWGSGNAYCEEEYRASVEIENRQPYYDCNWETIDIYADDNVTVPVYLKLFSESDKPVSLSCSIILIYIDIDKAINSLEKYSLGKLDAGIFGSAKVFEKDVHFIIFKDHYSNIKIKARFGNLKPGLYYAISRLADYKSISILHVSKAGLIVQASEDEAVLFAQDKMTSTPVPGMDISVRTGDKFVKIGRTDSKGIFRFKKSDLPETSTKKSNKRLFFLKASKGNDIALCKMGFISKPPDFLGYIYTDRPVYRRGDTVHFKGILRERKGNEFQPLTDKEVDVSISEVVYVEENAFKFYRKKIKPNNYGSITDTIRLGKNIGAGVYKITVIHNNKKQVGYFIVDDSIKPEYIINVKPVKKFVLQGEKAKFIVEVKHLSGVPFANAEITSDVYQSSYTGEYSRDDFDYFYYIDQYKNKPDPWEERLYVTIHLNTPLA